MKKQFLEIGKIVGTHGLKGEVKVDAWCDSPYFLCRFKRLYKKDGTEMKVISSKVHKNMGIILFDGVTSVEQADTMRGTVLYMNRDDARLPKGANFVQDLIGLKVIDFENETEYGVITDVIKTGANDVYQVEKNGKEYFVPVIPDVVKEKNIDEGFVKIFAMKGIFEDED